MLSLSRVLDLVFPVRCVGCHAPGSWICEDCLGKVQPIDAGCTKCGRPLPAPGLCQPCRLLPMHFTRARAVYQYEGVIREAIHRLKYRGLTAIAPSLSALLLEYVQRHGVVADLVVPVPLHAGRLRQRGYNQAELLAGDVARQLQLPLVTGPVERTRHTDPQVGLGAVDRHDNVRGAFGWRGDPLSGSRILLIDDVYTTGATLSDCARALKEAGAKSIMALAVARGN